jgi:hypothetical protein
MLYGEIEVGDVLEWKTFGSQSTLMIVTGHGEIMRYGSKKGEDKKYSPAVYVRPLESFDEDPQLVEVSVLRQNAKRVERDDSMQSEDSASTIAENTQSASYDEFSQGEAQDYSQADNRTSSDDDPRNRQSNAPEKKYLPEKQPLRRQG